jgi:hypothetical protein
LKPGSLPRIRSGMSKIYSLFPGGLFSNMQ